MCVAVIAWRAHPRWLLVAIGNRDEYHDRPAAPLARWDNGVVAGRDLVSGGTWLGVHGEARFALVTNLRGHGGPDPERASRGALVVDALTEAAFAPDPGGYNPFNLLVAGPHQAEFLTNRPEPVRTALAQGIYGLSNGPLDEPWPKTLQLKAALLGWLNAGGGDPSPLFAALRDETLPALGLHPRGPSDVPREPPETPPFIRDPVYGTRCSTVVTVDSGGAGTIIERSFAASGDRTGETRLDFAWPSP